MILQESHSTKVQFAGTCVLITIILSLADGLLTLTGISRGIFSELNPIADLMIRTSWILFIFMKVSLVSLGTLALYWVVKTKHARQNEAIFFLSIAALLYASVCIYQVLLLGGQ